MYKIVLLISCLCLSCSVWACGEDSSDDSSSNADEMDVGMEEEEEEQPECVTDLECDSEEAPYCEPVSQTCQAAPEAGLIGWGDGSEGSVTYKTVLKRVEPLETTGIAFNPLRPNELWMTQRRLPSTQPCTSVTPTQEGCAALEGVVTILFDPGASTSRAESLVDENAWHFMRRPPGLAFGAGETFATCGEERTGNFLDDPADFMGPSLWSTDLEIFAQPPGPGLNGSHLDMLHATPFCSGIVHESDNIYWVFNGNIGALDRYNFNEDHGVGRDDHSDGEVYRYVTGELMRVPDVPSGMAYDKETGLVYVSDTGHGRVIAVDPSTATVEGQINLGYEPLAADDIMGGATVTEIVPPGTLTTPSGMILHEDILYVADNDTSKIHAFDLEGKELRVLQTTLPQGALSAMTVGPDGKLYVADLLSPHIQRIDPKPER